MEICECECGRKGGTHISMLMGQSGKPNLAIN
jgi:hypothetical protein